MKINVLGIDLGKSALHVFGVDEQGKVVLRERMTRRKLREFMVNLPPCLVGMEACGGAHYWARVFKEHGHRVRLMSPQFVKPYVKSNKNDFLDAEAICEAVTRPTMRFVPIKSVEQQDIQSLHRARELAMSHRNAQANQLRGLLLEYGLVVPQGIGKLRKRLPEILEDAENGLSDATRSLLAALGDELVRLDARVGEFDRQIKALSQGHEVCRRLMSIPGIGPLIATALLAAVGDASVFKSGREMAAWLGIVPRQRTTGGRAVLLGISKRGDTYLRTLLIHGARAVLRVAHKRDDKRSRWVVALQGRRGPNVAAVALANKNVRTAWALLTRGTTFEVQAA